ncbi:hypothetical protein CBR_g17863 [Chara braunii]|uniref:DDE Tnp4 domain-containing protein n=1 Tax=Chara braunii TaxID=69332 RepID=A0A388KVR1_CHABU|nr:hypothetical protein CBR_g17863 [Chara braunii]|eukprot:GBG74150.1 hypothetical protein CBR_g17863 [Chara braunii]
MRLVMPPQRDRARQEQEHGRWVLLLVAVAIIAIQGTQEMETLARQMALLLQHFMQMSFESDLLQLAVLDSSFMIMATAMAVMEGPSPPRWWVRPRADGAWRNMTRGDAAAEDYYFDNIRMGEAVFRGLVANLEPYLERQHTWYRAPTPPDKLVAYALYRWATGASYEHSSASFGIGWETGRTAVRDVTLAILRAYPDEIAFPGGQRLQEAFAAFGMKGFPRCYGAIDCTHIFIDKPAGEMARPYVDRHRRFSVVAQVVVGMDLKIYDVYVGWPGSVHDVRVLMNSFLRERAEDGSLFCADLLALLGGIETRGYLLGDGGYPSLPWLVVPFGGPQEDGSDTEVFDTAQKRCRGCVERAFGRLKGMWRMFLRTHKPHITSLSLQFRAVCVIHNLLIRCGVQMDPALAPRNVHRHPDDDNDDDVAGSTLRVDAGIVHR